MIGLPENKKRRCQSNSVFLHSIVSDFGQNYLAVVSADIAEEVSVDIVVVSADIVVVSVVSMVEVVSAEPSSVLEPPQAEKETVASTIAAIANKFFIIEKVGLGLRLKSGCLYQQKGKVTQAFSENFIFFGLSPHFLR